MVRYVNISDKVDNACSYKFTMSFNDQERVTASSTTKIHDKSKRYQLVG